MFWTQSRVDQTAELSAPSVLLDKPSGRHSLYVLGVRLLGSALSGTAVLVLGSHPCICT